jgi:hypothetical protein
VVRACRALLLGLLFLVGFRRFLLLLFVLGLAVVVGGGVISNSPPQMACGSYMVVQFVVVAVVKVRVEAVALSTVPTRKAHAGNEHVKVWLACGAVISINWFSTCDKYSVQVTFA